MLESGDEAVTYNPFDSAHASVERLGIKKDAQVEYYETLIESYDAYKAKAKELLREAKRRAYRFPEEPQSGSMLKVEKRWAPGGPNYTFLFFRKGIYWYSTGKVGNVTEALTWEKVRDFIGDNRCWVLTAREEVPAKGAS